MARGESRRRRFGLIDWIIRGGTRAASAVRERRLTRNARVGSARGR